MAVLLAGSTDALGQLKSPDGAVKAYFMMTDDQRPAYRIAYRDRVVVESSELGLVRDKVDFSRNMRLDSVSSAVTVHDEYTLQHGKQRKIRYRANRKVYHLSHQSGRAMDIIFQVSNDGVAFRYRFPGESRQLHRISEERTSFNLPDRARAWLEPLANVNTGFANTNPSYEEHYHKDIAVGTAAPDSSGWAYPALFRTGDTWLLISEAGMNGAYAGTRLRQHAPDGNYRVGFPQHGEVVPGGARLPQSTLPWSTPWRILAIGSLETITESTLGTDLADPAAFTDTSWVKPGSASWSWAKLKDPSITYEVQKRFVDYASQMGWEYTLVDVNWDRTIGYDRIARLADYAASRDVGLLLWYNSSGRWNNTEYTPKSRLLTHRDRVEEFQKLRDMGIRGIKVDFFGGDGQSMIQYYRDIFKDAAAYKLLVNTHGSTLPRGWHRTWPNLMTMEAVKGFEFVTFEQVNANREAGHSAMLPFTRNVFDPMDFTPMSLTPLFNVERKTTNAFELALPVLFTSGIQHYAETARGMEQVPAYVRAFIRKIPVRWDEMEFIDGAPGKLAVIARRSGDRWFVAGINGENTEKNLTLELPFLDKGAAGVLITDGADRYSTREKNISLNESKKMDISMKGNGGFVILFDKNS